MKAMRSYARSGFTLPEVMIACGIFSLVILGVFTAFSHSTRWTRAGTSQVQFLGNARVGAETVVALIERGKAFSVTTNGVKVLFPDLSYGTIFFDAGDGDVGSVEDNRLVYDPIPATSGDEYTICEYVRPVDGDAVSNMFQVVLSSPNAVRIRFHVGDGTNVNDAAFSGTGQGYQGTEVRISASPRNLQKWYD